MTELDMIKTESETAKTRYPYANLIKILKSTDTYQRCRYEYTTYIKEIAKLIKSFSFTSSIDCVAYLRLLLASGHFSNNHIHLYKIFKYEKPEIMSLCGARVTTGKSVCRHQSSFMVDILTELGYQSAVISVVAAKTDNPIKEAKEKKISYNHAVVGITEDNSLYLFDPTNGLYSGLPRTIDAKKAIEHAIFEYISTGRQYLISNPNISILNHGDKEKTIEAIRNSIPRILTAEDTKLATSKAELIYLGSMKKQYEFYQSNLERIKRISELYQELTPHEDTPIKSWRLR